MRLNGLLTHTLSGRSPHSDSPVRTPSSCLGLATRGIHRGVERACLLANSEGQPGHKKQGLERVHLLQPLFVAFCATSTVEIYQSSRKFYTSQRRYLLLSVEAG